MHAIPPLLVLIVQIQTYPSLSWLLTWYLRRPLQSFLTLVSLYRIQSWMEESGSMTKSWSTGQLLLFLVTIAPLMIIALYAVYLSTCIQTCFRRIPLQSRYQASIWHCLCIRNCYSQSNNSWIQQTYCKGSQNSCCLAFVVFNHDFSLPEENILTPNGSLPETNSHFSAYRKRFPIGNGASFNLTAKCNHAGNLPQNPSQS